MEKYYVSGCIELEGTVGHVEDDTAEFFTLYEKKENGQSHALLDCVDRLSVEAAMAVYIERDALQEHLRALAAENILLKKFCKNAAFNADYEAELGMERGGFTDAFNNIKTPATDAILREIRAFPLESLAGVAETMLVKFSNQGASAIPEAIGWDMIKREAERSAARIRSGEQP